MDKYTLWDFSYSTDAGSCSTLDEAIEIAKELEWEGIIALENKISENQKAIEIRIREA